MIFSAKKLAEAGVLRRRAWIFIVTAGSAAAMPPVSEGPLRDSNAEPHRW
jgi:hypothetical protein